MSNCILARQFLWSGNFTATEDDRDTEQVDASDLHVPAPGKERLAARVFTDSEWKLLGRYQLQVISKIRVWMKIFADVCHAGSFAWQPSQEV